MNPDAIPFFIIVNVLFFGSAFLLAVLDEYKWRVTLAIALIVSYAAGFIAIVLDGGLIFTVLCCFGMLIAPEHPGYYFLGVGVVIFGVVVLCEAIHNGRLKFHRVITGGV